MEKLPRYTTLQVLAEIQNMMTEIKCEPEQFHGRIIFMSMFNDVVWRQQGNEEMCIAIFKIATDYANRFTHGHWSFLGPGSEKTWYGTHTYKPNGEWDRVAEDMLNCSEADTPHFVDPVLWNGRLKRRLFVKTTNYPQRIDPSEHEDRCSGGGSQSSSRTLRNRVLIR